MKQLANLDFDNVAKGINHPLPTAATDVPNKQYVDNAVAGISNPKVDVKAVQDANINISNPGTSTFDGYSASVNDRLLLTGQTTQAENGLWVFHGSSSALTRPTDFANASVQNGVYTFAVAGTNYAKTGWILTGAGDTTVGTTAEVWGQFTGLGDVIAGAGLTKTGNTISLLTPLGKYVVVIGDGATNPITVTHGLGNANLLVQVFDASGNKVSTDVRVTTTQIILTFAAPPATNAYTVVAIG